MHRSPKIGVVIDALPSYRGAERVLAAVLEHYPEADVHTLIYNREAFEGTIIAAHRVRTSFIQDLPGGRTHYRNMLPLLPAAIERLKVQDCDIVLSFSYAVAHGVKCNPRQLHISYTFSPLRYAWQDAGKYFQGGASGAAASLILRTFRRWDRAAVRGVDHMVAISRWTAECIRRAYRREAEVIYPPVEVEKFRPAEGRGDHFVAFARLVRQKRMEVVVEAFSKLGLPLIVIGEGPERKRLAALAAPNVRLVGAPSGEEAATIVGGARALVHAAEEDFGLVLAEAQAAGRPVIAYGGGAAPEVVFDGKTGVLFPDCTVDSLMKGVHRFLLEETAFKAGDCVGNVQRFRKERFQFQFSEMVEREWVRFEERVAAAEQGGDRGVVISGRHQPRTEEAARG